LMGLNQSIPMSPAQPVEASGEVNRKSVSVAIAATVGQLASPAGILNACMGLFLVPLTTTFHWSRTEFSVALMLQAWVMAVLFPITGGLMDRYGVRRVLLPGMCALTVAFVALALQPGNLYIYYAIFVLVGVCAASTGPVPCAKVVSGWFYERRGTALAWSALGLAFAAIALPPLVQRLMSVWGWRGGFFGLAGLVGIVGVPVVWRFLKEAPVVLEAQQAAARSAEPSQSDDNLGWTTRRATKTLEFWLSLTAVGLTVLVSASILSHVVALLGGRGVTAAQALTFVSLTGVGMGVVRLFEGFLLDAINSPKLGIPFALLCLVGVYLLQHGTSVPVFMLAGFLFGMGIGGETSFVPYAFSRFFGIRSLGQIYACGWACAAIAAGLGPLLMGMVYDKTGHYAIGIYAAYVAIAISALSFYLMPAYRFPAKKRTKITAQ
jgi:MFS family permease